MKKNAAPAPVWKKDPLLSFSLFSLSFSGGFFLYLLVEKIFKSFSHSATHWSMGLCAGLAFLFLMLLDGISLPLWTKALFGGLFVTLLELPAGLLLNLRYRMGVWDYSGMPLNYHGQICLSFSLLWCAASFGILLANRALCAAVFHLFTKVTGKKPDIIAQKNENN